MSTVIPYLTIRGAAAAIEFYKKAFNATEISRLPAPDGRLLHAQLKIGDSFLYLSDEFPEHQSGCTSPASLNGSTVTIHLNVPDVDSTVGNAIAAGAIVTMPVADMFWGDRFGKLRDPFGHHWSVATTKQKLTPEQIQKAAATAFAQHKRGHSRFSILLQNPLVTLSACHLVPHNLAPIPPPPL